MLNRFQVGAGTGKNFKAVAAFVKLVADMASHKPRSPGNKCSWHGAQNATTTQCAATTVGALDGCLQRRGELPNGFPCWMALRRWRWCRKKSGPGKTRTCDIQFRKLTFCPAELRDHVLCGNRRKDSNKPPPERTPCAVSKRKLSFPRYRLNLTQPNCNGRSCRRRLLWGIQNSC